MRDGTENLKQMAAYDARIFELKKGLRRFPIKLGEARKQLVAEEKLLKELQDPWDDLEFKISEKESTIQVALDTIEKFEEHIKRVTTQKEYMAAKKQVEEARRLNTQLQDEILESRVKQEEIAPRLKEIRERHDNVLAAYQEQEKTILAEQVEYEQELAEQEAILKGLVEQAGDDVWNYYEKLVRGGKTPSIVPAPGGSCGGCHMAIPPQSYNQMIANPEAIHTCTHCNRIVYYDPPAPEPEEKAAEAPPAPQPEANAAESMAEDTAAANGEERPAVPSEPGAKADESVAAADPATPDSEPPAAGATTG